MTVKGFCKDFSKNRIGGAPARGGYERSPLAIAEPQNIRSFFLEKGGSKTAPYKVAVQFAETAG